MKSKIKKIWKYIFPLFISIFLLYWRYGDLIGSSNNNSDIQNNIHYVKTIIAKKELYKPFLSVYGTFEPSGIIEVPIKYSGTIDRFYVEEGDYVKINQPLFKMNTLLIEIDYEKQLKTIEVVQAQVRLYKEKYKKSQIAIRNKFFEYKKLRNLESKYKMEISKLQEMLRIKKELYAEGAIPGEELKILNLEYGVKSLLSTNSSLDVEISLLTLGQEVSPLETKELSQKNLENATIAEQAELSAIESNLKLAEIQLRILGDSIKNSTILSPIDGRVLKIRKNAGEYIQSQSSGSILSLGIVNSLNAVFYIGEKDTNLVKKGNIVVLKTDIYGEKEWSGVVKNIFPLYEDKSFSNRIKVEVKNENLLLHPGNFFRGNLYHGVEQKRIVLPSDILVGEEFIYTIVNDKAVRKKIKSLPLGNGNLEIIEGITDNEEVILEGKSYLSDGVTVVRK